MVGRCRSTGELNRLLKISVRLEHYVELSTKDTFDTEVFQTRLKQHFSIPWHEPKTPIKTSLCVTYTSLILSSASWWPYRQQRCLDFENVQRFLTFYQAGRYCAIGVQDNDMAEKQFVVLLTKSIGDLDSLLRVMHTQLSFWKRIDHFDEQPDRPIAVVPVSWPTLKAQPVSLPRVNLYGNNGLHSVSSTFNQNQSNNGRYFSASQEDVTHSKTVMLKACECKSQLPRFHVNQLQHRGKMSERVIDVPRHRPSVIRSRTLGTSNLSTVHEEKLCHKTIIPFSGSINKLENGNHKASYRQQPPGGRPSDTDSTSWEVDIKYVRRDPVLGNVLDDQGSVYLYTAHQVKR
ncbi:hypothetical protein FBUS_01485 [Fasciolopsis buskii]|uniref:Uncharacterized protein n=1 Tax=Fasciolopsis buskii TaxID=27845 RepID=A0A8E0RXI6_9TREM|nr:hypothetical protein FBUS_01485 [Fasciolopsis buski]